jgi:3-oxoacyl-[acyl-carrier-protein] synthase III
MKIVNTGSYLPEKVIYNKDFEAFLDTSEEWIVTRTGIKTRHIATDEETSDMAFKAAAQATEGFDVSKIDLVVSTSVTHEYFTPSLSCRVAEHLGIAPVCLDINAACAGFSYALDLVQRYFATEPDFRYALVVSAEQLSRITDFTDRASCVLFGDGAGAVLVEKSAAKFASALGSEPGLAALYAKSIPNANPWLKEAAAPVNHGLYMNGKDVYKFATRVLPEYLTRACGKLGITPSELSLVVPHQANVRIIETSAKNLGLPLERFMLNIDRYGNTSSASCAIALDEAFRAGKVSGYVGFVGFGAGLTAASVVIEA